MRFKILSLLLSLVLFSCSGDDNVNNCNFLFNVNVDFDVNLNLPFYNELQFISNSVKIDGIGNAGIIVTNVGTGLRAWDAADPNLAPSACTSLTINGTEAVSSCQDPNSYSLFTGQALNEDLPCGLKEYRIIETGNNLFTIIN